MLFKRDSLKYKDQKNVENKNMIKKPTRYILT